ncbi:MAG: hypothetical protein ACOYO1_18595 [Bacteroidales bacterium]
MRKIKILILTLLISFTSFGQVDSVDYNFINSALRQVSKYDNSYFLLQSKSYKCYFSEKLFEFYKKELKGRIDTVTLKEIIRNSNSSSKTNFEFDTKLIAKDIGANIITASTVDSLQMNENKAQPLKTRLFYICSEPVYNNKKTFAVIEFGGGTRRLAMLGKKYLFKKTKNGWKLIATFDNWVS